MVNKNKNTLLAMTKQASQHISLLLMLGATCISMAELAQRESQRFAFVVQPAFAYATQNVNTSGRSDEMMRRDKEEIGHSSSNYVAARRSHSVTGTV